jgi:hypothetical protein
MAENEIITIDGEVITAAATESLAIGLTKAEIDQQVATAKAYPRSISRVSQNILSLVTIDEQAAEECNYALPRGGKPITGPSIRLAEIIASEWGNNRNGARVVHIDRAEKYIEAEGVFLDLEKNTATTARVRRRISDKNGRLLSDDMIIVTGNAAGSIAKRNAILAGVPKAVWRKAYEAALATIKGDVKTLTERRDKALKAFAAFGVKPEQLFVSLEIGGIDDITLDHIALLMGMHSALKSGEETVETMFGGSGKPESAAAGKQNLKDKLADVAGGGDKVKDKKPADAAAGRDKAAGKPADKPKDSAPTEGKTDEQTEGKGDAAPGASDGQGGDDTFPGDLPSGDEIEAAKTRGGDAYNNGMSRKAIPGEYRAAEKKALADAWLASFDEARAEDEASQNGGAA